MSDIKTWGEAFDYVWKVHWKRLPSAGTNRINAGHITAYCGRSFPLRNMAKGAWWETMISDLQDEHPRWSTSTVNRVVSAGTTVLRRTAKAGLHSVICPEFDRLKEGEARREYFSKKDVDQLAHIATDIFDRSDMSDALLVSAYAGPRQGELLKLRVRDIDLNSNNIWIGGKPDNITKARNCRAVPIHDRIKPLLMDRLANREQQDFLFADDWANKDDLYRVFKKVRKQAGFSEEFVWHSLRHSFGTWLGEVCHPRQIMALMGHKQIETSLLYCKPTDAAARSAISAL